MSYITLWQVVYIVILKCCTVPNTPVRGAFFYVRLCTTPRQLSHPNTLITYRDIAEDEVDHLFAAADDDGDDILSFLEVLEHHDVFVGSEATDYGDHLHNLDRFEDEL